MPEASIMDVRKFFKIGDAERDQMKAFKAEWDLLSDADKDELKKLVGAELA